MPPMTSGSTVSRERRQRSPVSRSAKQGGGLWHNTAKPSSRRTEVARSAVLGEGSRGWAQNLCHDHRVPTASRSGIPWGGTWDLVCYPV